MSSAKGPLEVPTDEMKVKLVGVIVFFCSHIRVHGCWPGVGGELA